jgi:hypothetical protein
MGKKEQQKAAGKEQHPGRQTAGRWNRIIRTSAWAAFTSVVQGDLFSFRAEYNEVTGISEWTPPRRFFQQKAE